MKNKKVLVVVSHGSKRQESNEEFNNFIQKLNEINQRKLKEREIEELEDKFSQPEMNDNKTISYKKVSGACLEFASPQLETVIEDLVKNGYNQLDILPLFIFAGYHVRQDIPERMEVLKNKYENLEYDILNHPAAEDGFAYYIFNHSLRN